MKLVKKMAMVAGVAMIALTSLAVFAKVNAANENHILNMDGSTYVTQDPGSCPGITFPTPITYGETTPSIDNQITVDPTIARTQRCSKLYTNGDDGYQGNARCMIALKVKHGQVVKISAHGDDTRPGGAGCRVDHTTGDVKLLYSGS